MNRPRHHDTGYSFAIAVLMIFLVGVGFLVAQSSQAATPLPMAMIPQKELVAAADADQPEAITELGRRYFYGIKGVEKDFTQASVCFRRAAGMGDPVAEFYLAMMHYDGIGMPTNYASAFRYYRLAAEAGLAEAQYAVGKMYRDGEAVEADPVRAAHYFQRAADQGHAMAQFHLANAYATGSGVGKDLERAMRYYSLSAEQGNPAAKRMRDRLKVEESIRKSEFATQNDESNVTAFEEDYDE